MGDFCDTQHKCEILKYHRQMMRVLFSSADPPVIYEGPGEIEAIQSQEFVLTCKARGVPDPKYEFFKVCGFCFNFCDLSLRFGQHVDEYICNSRSKYLPVLFFSWKHSCTGLPVLESGW